MNTPQGQVGRVSAPAADGVENDAAAVRDEDGAVGPSPDDDPMGEWDEEDEHDPGDECGRWRNGVLGPFRNCLQAGTEFCQFDCPYGR